MESRDIETARKEYLKALKLDVNFNYVYTQLIRCAPTNEEDQIQFFDEITQLLIDGVLDSDGVEGVVSLIENVFSTQKTIDLLLEIKKNRPDLTSVWEELIVRSSQEKVMELIQEAEQRFPYHSIFHYRRAVVYVQNGRLQDAEDLLATILQTRPLYSQARCYRGWVLGRLHRIEEAEAEYRHALELEPYSIPIIKSFCEFFEEQSRYETALQLVDDALKKMVETPPLMIKKIEFLQQLGFQEKAAKIAEAQTENNPWHLGLRLVAVDAYMAISNLEHALIHLDVAQKLTPHNENVYEKRIEILSRQHQFHAALKVVTEAENICSDSLDFKIEKVSILRSLGQKEKANELLETLLSKNPTNSFVLRRFVDFLVDDERYSEARILLEEWVETMPENTDLTFLLADLLESKIKDFPASEKVYRSILKEHPSYAPALCGIFDCMTAIGKKRVKALVELEQATEQNPALLTPYITYRLALITGALHKHRGFKKWIYLLKEQSSELPSNLFGYLYDNLDLHMRRVLYRHMKKMIKHHYHPYIANLIAHMQINCLLKTSSGSEVKTTCLPRLCRMALAQTPIDAQLLCQVIENINRGMVEFLGIRWFIWRNKETFRNIPETWESIAVYKNDAKHYRQCLEWTHDWTQRTGVTFRVLSIRLDALYALQEFNQARDFITQVLESIPHDSWSHNFAAMAFSIFAQNQDFSKCEQLEQTFKLDSCVDEKNYYNPFYRFGRALQNHATTSSQSEFTEFVQFFSEIRINASVSKSLKLLKKQMKAWIAEVKKSA